MRICAIYDTARTVLTVANQSEEILRIIVLVIKKRPVSGTDRAPLARIALAPVGDGPTLTEEG